MNDIRSFIKSHLLEPLKNYPTIIQDTMIEIITEKLQRLYEYTVKFPEILTPSQHRLDILQIIADQFLFTIREEADLQEQIDILDKILHVYSKRGSIDTIENMWNYYGGNLPKDVIVYVPSYHLFRYSVSRLSGTDAFCSGSLDYVILDKPLEYSIDSGTLIRKVGNSRLRVTPGAYAGDTRIFLSTVDEFSKGDALETQDSLYLGRIIEIYSSTRESYNRPGVYEIKLYNNTYPIPDLKDFLIKELVAAGNSIYFSSMLHLDVSHKDEKSNPYKYLVDKDTIIDIQLEALASQRGMKWSAYNKLSGRLILPERLSEAYDRYTRGVLSDEETLTLIEELQQLPSNSYGNALWSGKESILLELSTMIEIGDIFINPDGTSDLLPVVMNTCLPILDKINHIDNIVSYVAEDSSYYTLYLDHQVSLFSILYCTPTSSRTFVEFNLYNKTMSGQEYEVIYKYPGVFILGDTHLGDYIKGIPSQ